MSTLDVGLCTGACFHEAIKCIHIALKDVLNVSKSDIAILNRMAIWTSIDLSVTDCRLSARLQHAALFCFACPPCASETKFSFRVHVM